MYFKGKNDRKLCSWKWRCYIKETNTKMAVSWDVAPCSLVQLTDVSEMMFRVVFWDILPCKMIVDRRFRWSSLMMEAVRTSETSVDINFTRQYNPEDTSEHHTRHRENLKSHVSEMLTASVIRVMMEAVNISETSASVWETKWRNIPRLAAVRTWNLPNSFTLCYFRQGTKTDENCVFLWRERVQN
jgi:hypothetical protein